MRIVLKAELHAHTGDDPVDFVPHDTVALIDRVAELGYQVLAITLHDRQLDTTRMASHARDRGVVLIGGIERTICGKHVLLLNFPEAAVNQVRSFDDLGRVKDRWNGLVIAPHPFYPSTTCLHGDLSRYADLFDAVEINAFYTRLVDFNRPVVRWAKARGKPMVGNGDIHRLFQLAKTYSMIDAPLDVDAICTAVRGGHVEVRTRPLSSLEAAAYLSKVLIGNLCAAVARRTEAVLPGLRRSV